MFCRKCGEQLPDTASFCSNCGNACVKPILPVQEAAPEASLVVEPIPVEIPEEVPAQEVVAVAEETAAEEVVAVAEEAPAEENVAVAEEAPAEEIAAVVEETSVEEVAEEVPAEDAEVAAEEVTEEVTEEVAAEEIVEQEEIPAEVVEEAPVEAVVQEEPVQQIPVEIPVPQAAPAQPAPQQGNKIKKRPCFGVRFLMQLLSLILCLTLVVTLVVGVLVMDLRRLTSSGGLKTIIDGVLFSDKKASASVQELPPAAPQISNGYGVLTMGNTTLYMEEYEPDTDEIAGMESVDELIDWLYEELKENVEDVDFSKSEFKEFVNTSTVGDYLSEKMAGFAEDVLNGTTNTDITTDEVMNLLEENERQLKKDLGVELSASDKRELRKSLNEEIEEADLVNNLRESVSEEVNDALEESAGIDLATMQSYVRALNSNAVLFVMLGVILLLMGLLLLLNFYNLGAGLTWSASAGLLVGLIMSLPLMLLEPLMGIMFPDGDGALVANVVPAVADAFAPIHYGLLGISFVLLVGSIVIRCISRKRRRMQRLAA